MWGKGAGMTQPADRDIFGEALALYRQGRRGEARNICESIVSARPGHTGALHLLGVLALEDGRAEDAIRRLVETGEAGDPRIHSALATAWRMRGRPAEAAAAARRAAALAPGHAEFLYNLGNALQHLGDERGAEAAYRWSLASRPGLVNGHWNLALLLLRGGRFAEGWAEYEWRWRRPGAPLHYRGRPCWDGGPFPGRTLLLYSEQGLGDTLQFVRYLPAVQALGGAVVLECAPSLVRLLQHSLPGVTVAARGEAPLEDFDLQLSLPSLPLVFGTTLETIPAPPRYLTPPAGGARLPDGAGLKVGLVWGGSANKPERDLPFAGLAPLLAVPGVRFFSLQVGPHARALREAPAEAVRDLAPEIGDFGDTAEFADQLDVVVTVDTSVAHLAAALGRPTWILLEHLADWRWLKDREDSPWYPSVRLFRQPAHGAWRPAVEAVAAALAAAAVSPAPSPPAGPPSSP